jgi:hypothetical protein
MDSTFHKVRPANGLGSPAHVRQDQGDEDCRKLVHEIRKQNRIS